MDIRILPGLLAGQISVPPSKSCAHRMLICAALGEAPMHIDCGPVGKDVQATIDCLNTLGAKIVASGDGYDITPITQAPQKATLPCGESGSTLRFLLPIAGSLGVEATFLLEGRLPCRPLSPLWEEMERMGCHLSRPTESTLLCRGKLHPGTYRLEASISSQFVSGLLMALPLLKDSQLEISGPVSSGPYVELTKDILHQIPAKVEGDWSSAAFFAAANALGSKVDLLGLNDNSRQADRAITELLPLFAGTPTVSAADIPDLIPILSVVAAAKQGAVFTDIARLRLKESDRVAAIIQMLTALGGYAEATENTLTVHPARLIGGIVDAKNDHRMAMAAAIAATVCEKEVTILGAACVQKSYPAFWEDYEKLGGSLCQVNTGST